MNNLRRKWNRFLYNNADKGIPNLMAVISIGTLLVYLISMMDPSGKFLYFLAFNRNLILRGQLWRLITFVFVPTSSGIWLFLLLFAYFSIGRMVESVWGTLKFNLFYFCGMLFTALGGLIFNAYATAYYLNLSLFMALATMFPDNKVLLMYIIPLKMKYLAWVYLLFMVLDIIQGDFFSVIALANYFLFFGKDCLNVLPGADRVGARTISFKRKRSKNTSRPNPDWAAGYQKRPATPKKEEPAYRHKCTVCGRTDVSHPNLEFRYCSRCAGYYCYCEEHINNHTHIQ